MTTDFKFIVPGRLVALRVSASGLSLHPEHFLTGSVFTLNEDGELACDQQPLRRGWCHVQCGDLYLNEDLRFQHGKDNALALQAEEIDLDDPPTLPSRYTIPSVDSAVPAFMSVDGVSSRQPDAWFYLALFDNFGQLYEDETALRFGSSGCREGLCLRLTDIDGRAYVVTESGMYLGLGVDHNLADQIPADCNHDDEQEYCDECNFARTIVLSSTLPKHPVVLVPQDATRFLLSDGAAYFQVDWVTSSYGTLGTVQEAEEAQLFQLMAA
ncbi:hypothetical protein RI367_005954 [Sorochytrium milnesiophthora]